MRFLLRLFFFFPFVLSAQISSNSLTDNFAFEVKSIDDFIERFNFEQGTDFSNYLKTAYPSVSYSRRTFLLSLFNQKNKSFYDNLDVDFFIHEVADTAKPRYIHFSDYEWYAMAECKVIYKKKIRTLDLILKVERDVRKSVKWSIVSAKAGFLGVNPNSYDSLYLTVKNEYNKNRMLDSSRYFLHPVSHAIDFMNVDDVFSKKKHFDDYLYAGPKSAQLVRLTSLIHKSEIKFLQVNAISYHFLQVKGWIMIVDYFNRNERNSGWLINALTRATPEQKRIYLQNHLNVKMD
jgi:hypothetical protein